MKRILFVDDQPEWLAGLARSLHSDRARWTMVFAVDAVEAFEAFKGQPFDAVVSDLHMPGLDGVALLSRVRAMWPRTARIVLSGSVWKSTGDGSGLLAHEVLSKPCPVEALRSCLERHLAHT
jgi:CheY-like chemotaxis protein